MKKYLKGPSFDTYEEPHESKDDDEGGDEDEEDDEVAEGGVALGG